MSKEPLVDSFDDNPEWTEADFARARPAATMLPPEVVAAFARNKGGRPRGSNKEQVALRTVMWWRASAKAAPAGSRA